MSVFDCAKSQPFITYKPASFEEPVSETRCRYRFALRCYRVRGCTAPGRSDCSAGKAKKISHPWRFRCWSPRRNELASLSAPISFTGQRHCTFFVTWWNFRCWFCVRKALWRWFFPRSRKRDHFQTLATGVPKLKTWLGTQRVNNWKRQKKRSVGRIKSIVKNAQRLLIINLHKASRIRGYLNSSHIAD